MRIPLLVNTTGLAAAMLLFAACSAASSPSASTSSNTASGRDASSDVLLSAQQSVGAGTAQVDVTAQLNLPVLGEQTATGTGVVDFAAQKAQAQLDAAGIELDGVVDGDVAYLRSPLLGADTWYRMDTAGDNSGGLPDIWAQIVDPSQLFNSLQDASSSMVAVGSEQVNGVQATHYHGELDLQKAAQAAGGSTSNPNPNATAATDVPIDVWVDAQGLVTRVQVSLASTGDQGSQGGSGSAVVTVNLHDYGKPVTVTVPPSNQVKDLSDALGGLGGFLKGG